MAGYKILGQKVPAAEIWEKVYEVPEGLEAVGSSVVVCNDSEVTTDFSIAATPADEDTVTQKNLLHQLIPLPYPETFIATIGFTLEAGAALWVRSTAGDVSFTIFGKEQQV